MFCSSSQKVMDTVLMKLNIFRPYQEWAHFSIIVCVYVYVCVSKNSVIGLKLKQLFDIMRHTPNFSLNHFFISNKVDLLCHCHSSVVQNPCPVRNKLSARGCQLSDLFS